MRSPGGSWRDRLVLPLVLLAGLVGGALIDGGVSLRPVRSALQRQYAHRADFPGNKTLKLLVEQGALHPHPINRTERTERESIVARRRRGGTQSAAAMNLYALAETPAELLPSTTRLPAGERESSVPVLSVAIAPRDLGEMLGEPLLRGRASERTAYVSYLRPDRPILGFSAGIRLHGGRSRYGSVKKSFRLYLRPVHGTESLPSTTFFAERRDAPSTLTRLVVHNDVRSDNFDEEWHFVNPIAYEIAHRIGCLTPRTRPVRFYLNGELQGAYVLTEYLDTEYFESLLGHSDFVMARTKLDQRSDLLQAGDRSDYLEFLEWARLARRRPQGEIPLRVNTENLLRWFVSTLLCGTADMLQGPLVRDNLGPDRRWFWANWDMDHSFMSAGRRTVERPWEANFVGPFFDRREPRPTLVRRLVRSRQFGPGFADLFSEAVNHRVTGDWVTAMVDRYERLAADLGVGDLSSFERVREFLEKRPAIARRELSRELRVGPSYQVRVETVSGRSLEVDGHTKNRPYLGWYFEGRPVKVTVSEQDRDAFAHWEIDGEVLAESEPTIEWSVRSDTRIAAVFAR